jgi:hypothetical protein
MDKYEFVHFVNLETLLKCSQNASNIKYMFCFDLVGWDAKNVLCYQCNSWELILLSMPPKQCTLVIIYISKIPIVTNKFS